MFFNLHIHRNYEPIQLRASEASAAIHGAKTTPKTSILCSAVIVVLFTKQRGVNPVSQG